MALGPKRAPAPKPFQPCRIAVALLIANPLSMLVSVNNGLSWPDHRCWLIGLESVSDESMPSAAPDAVDTSNLELHHSCQAPCQRSIRWSEQRTSRGGEVGSVPASLGCSQAMSVSKPKCDINHERLGSSSSLIGGFF